MFMPFDHIVFREGKFLDNHALLKRDGMPSRGLEMEIRRGSRLADGYWNKMGSAKV